MYSPVVVVLSALAATASADMQPMRIPVPKRGVEPRQFGGHGDGFFFGTGDLPTGTADASCESAIATIYSLVTDVPTPPAEVDAYIATLTDDVDPCTFTVPASLSSEYDAWTAEVLSWYSASADAAVSTAVGLCPELADHASDLDLGFCTPTPGAPAAVPTPDPAPTPASGGNGTVTTPTLPPAVVIPTAPGVVSPAPAPIQTAGGVVLAREVGVVGAVFVGVLGAAIAL